MVHLHNAVNALFGRQAALYPDAVQNSGAASYRAAARGCPAICHCALHGRSAGMVQMRMTFVNTHFC
jgi:hypothetical protein